MYKGKRSQPQDDPTREPKRRSMSNTALVDSTTPAVPTIATSSGQGKTISQLDSTEAVASRFSRYRSPGTIIPESVSPPPVSFDYHSTYSSSSPASQTPPAPRTTDDRKPSPFALERSLSISQATHGTHRSSSAYSDDIKPYVTPPPPDSRHPSLSSYASPSMDVDEKPPLSSLLSNSRRKSSPPPAAAVVYSDGYRPPIANKHWHAQTGRVEVNERERRAIGGMSPVDERERREDRKPSLRELMGPVGWERENAPMPEDAKRVKSEETEESEESEESGSGMEVEGEEFDEGLRDGTPTGREGEGEDELDGEEDRATTPRPRREDTFDSQDPVAEEDEDDDDDDNSLWNSSGSDGEGEAERPAAKEKAREKEAAKKAKGWTTAGIDRPARKEKKTRAPFVEPADVAAAAEEPTAADDFLSSISMDPPSAPVPRPFGVRAALMNSFATSTAGLPASGRVLPLPPRVAPVPQVEPEEELGPEAEEEEQVQREESPAISLGLRPSEEPEREDSAGGGDGLEELEDYEEEEVEIVVEGEEDKEDHQVLGPQPFFEHPTEAGALQRWFARLKGRGDDVVMPDLYSRPSLLLSIEILRSHSIPFHLPPSLTALPPRAFLAKDIKECDLLSYRPGGDPTSTYSPLKDLWSNLLTMGQLDPEMGEPKGYKDEPRWWPKERKAWEVVKEELRKESGREGGVGEKEMEVTLKEVFKGDGDWGGEEEGATTITEVIYKRNWIWYEQLLILTRVSVAYTHLANDNIISDVRSLHERLSRQLDEDLEENERKVKAATRKGDTSEALKWRRQGLMMEKLDVGEKVEALKQLGDRLEKIKQRRMEVA